LALALVVAILGSRYLIGNGLFCFPELMQVQWLVSAATLPACWQFYWNHTCLWQQIFWKNNCRHLMTSGLWYLSSQFYFPQDTNWGR